MIYLENERRRNDALMHYWQKLAGERPLPSEDDIDFDQIHHLWDECFLLQHRDVLTKKDYNYTYFGRSIQMAYQAGQIPSYIKGMVAPEANHLSELFSSVIANPAPLITEGEHEIPGRGILRFRQILLPLGFDGVTVHAVLGRLGFRVYLEGEELP